MEREILAYIKQNRMIGKNDVVLAGVSGGSDSMAMLRILKELQEKLDFTLRVVHIHTIQFPNHIFHIFTQSL